MIDIEAVRSEMLKCFKGCSASVMVGSREVSLMWRVGAHWHQEFIKKDDCRVGSTAFKDALAGAANGLIY